MNALNVPVPEVTRSPPPLVVDMGNGSFAWIERGFGFVLHTSGCSEWHPITDGGGIGGTVLKDDQVAVLVAEFGRPLP